MFKYDIEITENNELSASRWQVDDTGELLSTEIDAGVSELSWVDVEVTCDVCSVVHCSHLESRLKLGDDPEAAVDGVVSAFKETLTGRNTRTVEPE